MGFGIRGLSDSGSLDLDLHGDPLHSVPATPELPRGSANVAGLVTALIRPKGVIIMGLVLGALLLAVQDHGMAVGNCPWPDPSLRRPRLPGVAFG